MVRDFWENEDNVSEYELLADEANEAVESADRYDRQPAAPIAVVQATEEEIEEVAEESAFDLNEHESNIVFNARLRLETAKLYEMLINHDLFEGVEANPQAISRVQNELKIYIVERLEVLLGIREDRVKTKTQEETSIVSNFNEIEVDFLKQLAYKGTMGASTIASAPLDVPRPKPIVLQPNKLKSLSRPTVPSPIAVQKTQALLPPRKTPVKAPIKTQALLPPRKTPVKAPIKTQAAVKQKNNPNKPPPLQSGFAPRNLTQSEIDTIARKDLEETKNRKPFHKMNAKEKAAEVARVNSKHSRVKSTAASVPIMSPEQQQMMYLQRQSRAQNKGNQKTQINQMIAGALSKTLITEVNSEEY